MTDINCICDKLKLARCVLQKQEWVTPPKFNLHQYSCATVELVKVVIPCITTHYCNISKLTPEQQHALREKKHTIGKQIQQLQQTIYSEMVRFYKKAGHHHQVIEQHQQCHEDHLEAYYQNLVTLGYVKPQDVITACAPPGYLNRQGLEDALTWYPTNVVGSGNPLDGVLSDPVESTPTGTGIDLKLELQREDQLSSILEWVTPRQEGPTIEFWETTLPAISEIQHQISSISTVDDPVPPVKTLDHPKESVEIMLPFNPIWKQRITSLITCRNQLLDCIACCT